MKTLTHRVAGAPCSIHFYEGENDLPAFTEWLSRPRPILALDTETSGGFDILALDFGCRVVQVGDAHTAWIIPATYVELIQRAVRSATHLVMHNAPYDLLVLDVHLGLPLAEVHAKTIDTYVLSHIIDSREARDGGVGHGLKEQAAYYVDPEAQDGQKALKEEFARLKLKGDAAWREIPLDNEIYLRYGGLDVILLARLYEKLLPHLAGFERLSRFEHQVQRLLLRMERRGILLDVDYTAQLAEQLDETVETNTAEIERLVRSLGCAKLTPRGLQMVLDITLRSLGGVPPRRRASKVPAFASVTADSKCIAPALVAMGETLDKRTKTGQIAVDGIVLDELCDINKDGERLDTREPNPLAVLVKETKRAGKWNSSYAEAMLRTRDAADRVHPRIAGLKARTARMSISNPPFQQLPSSGRLIRDCLIADPGKLLISADFDQIEMRLLAAMAEEPRMIAAIKGGVDLHDMTATVMFGPQFTKKQRKLAKVAGFARVYGGGAAVIAAQTGISFDAAKDVNATYDESFPGIKEWGYKLQRLAEKADFNITTPLFGRRLAVDEDRVYAVTNYVIQSTARDVFAQALLDLDAAGLGEHLLLPVHDEVIAQADEDIAKEIAQTIGEVMTRDFHGVPITSTGEVLGHSWGDGYGA